LIYLDVPSSSSQTYSVEITNGSTVPYNCFAEIVAFDVTDAAFLDTGSVAVATTQTTVGNLITNLSGNVAVIALAAAERTATSDGDTFLENAVVLQKDNSSTDQVSNLVRWYIYRNSYNARSGVLPLFRYDANVSNPSYQVKMTANSGSPNGEAKILAFSLVAPVLVTVTDFGTGTEDVSVSVIATDSAIGSDVVDMTKEIPDAGTGVEVALLSMPVDDTGTSSDIIDVSAYGFADDAGTGAEDVLLSVISVSDDSGFGSEVVDVSSTVSVDDAGTGYDFITGGFFFLFDDSGAGADEVMLAKEVLDTGAAVESVGATRESIDSGVGVEAVETAEAGTIIAVLDAGAGIDVIDMVKEVLDTGAGVDAVLFVSREVLDTGTAVELPTAITSIPVFDSGTGLDVVGIIATITVIDAGAGVEEATRTLSIFGDVTIDEIEIIGLHSIPYTDLVQDRLPIQVQRNVATDFVYIDGDQVGDVLVEWEDRVADVYRGRRTITVMGLVRIVD
jgi:hypothetical protein